MRYKTLFRMLLKAMGVYFFVMGCGQLLGTAGVRLALQGNSGWTVAQGLSVTMAPLFNLSIGLYLFFGGRRLADMAIPSNRTYCPECGYDVMGSQNRICPECGTDRESGQRKQA
jgi:hypothetical protein